MECIFVKVKRRWQPGRILDWSFHNSILQFWKTSYKLHQRFQSQIAFLFFNSAILHSQRKSLSRWKQLAWNTIHLALFSSSCIVVIPSKACSTIHSYWNENIPTIMYERGWDSVVVLEIIACHMERYTLYDLASGGALLCLTRNTYYVCTHQAFHIVDIGLKVLDQCFISLVPIRI